MNRSTRYTSVLAIAALLAAPGLAAGVEIAASMPCCDHARGPAPCHGEPAAAMDCCLVQPAQQPVDAVIPADARGAAPVASVAVSPALAAPVPPPATLSGLADSIRLHGLGRYTLFASLLL